jgi:L-iditol 2-dehydrogenase
MRALVKREAGSAPRIEERPDPVPGRGEALVAVRAVGICGTDLHILDDSYPHAEPLIPGHEFAGEVLRIEDDGGAVAGGEGGGAVAGGETADAVAGGETADAVDGDSLTGGDGLTGDDSGEDRVEGLRPGDRVVGELHVGACRVCETCRAGNPHICPHKRALGTWSDGAFAELLRIPSWLLRRIPPGLSDPEATLIEPAACAWHGIFERSHLDHGDRVLVVGHGPIGLLSAQVASVEGASQVIVVGRSGRGTARLRCAAALGFDVIDAAIEDVEARVGELTAGRGVDLAVETAGAEDSLAACIRCCRRGGRIVVLGVSGRPQVSLCWNEALQRDLTIAFSFSSRARSWEGVLELAAAGALPARALITDVLALEQWPTAIDAIRSGRAVKVVLAP